MDQGDMYQPGILYYIFFRNDTEMPLTWTIELLSKGLSSKLSIQQTINEWSG